MEDDREALRATFDSVAGHDDRARPEYPEAVFDVLCRQTGLRPGDRVLEVGCATGKATRPLAERGLRLTCVELGAELAATAHRNLAGFPDVDVVNAAFETWRPPQGTAFDAVVAATAWHWADPELRYRRAWELLRPGGHLAFWAAVHVLPAAGDPIFVELQDVYNEIGAGRVESWPQPRELPNVRGEILPRASAAPPLGRRAACGRADRSPGGPNHGRRRDRHQPRARRGDRWRTLVLCAVPAALAVALRRGARL